MLRNILIGEAVKLIWDRINRDSDDQHTQDRDRDDRDRHDRTETETQRPFDTLLHDARTVLGHTLSQATAAAAMRAAPLAESLRARAQEIAAQDAPTVRDLKREERAARHEGQEAIDTAREQAQRAAYGKVREARLVQRRALKRAKKAHKRTSRSLKRQHHELRTLEKRARRLGARRRDGSGSGLLYLGLLLGALYYLARHPHLRHQVLDAVGQVSPPARDWLHEAGHSAKQILGEFWIEEETQAGGAEPQRTRQA